MTIQSLETFSGAVWLYLWLKLLWWDQDTSDGTEKAITRDLLNKNSKFGAEGIMIQ